MHSSLFDDIEFVAIETSFRSENVIFACFYRPNVADVSVLPMLKNAIRFLLAKRKPLVLMGDFNLPGVRWFDGPSADALYEQDEFLNMFLEFGLSQMVNAPTRSSAILDLVFTNEPNLVSGVSIMPPLSSTCDHNVVNFKINLRVMDDTERIPPGSRFHEFACMSHAFSP